ncbi:hypothetical protein EMPS_11444 [Entomortierella parvispora]|uniref:Uncharacterized protein n=1 Tax=Entomortierella parvispora TaxID=205924 RepID=A0A9P3HM31_9FUNG|nr:hypothetical protein EMPS_11444 [Entomortierella parvispora]
MILKTSQNKKALEGNLCGELRRMFDRANRLINTEESKEALNDLKMVKENLKTAMATFITQGGCTAFSGKLPKLVESSFGRIRTIDGVYETVIDEPFAFKAADNYFQSEDPEYATHRRNLMYGSPTEQIRGKLWEFSISYEMVRLFEDRIVPRLLFRDDVVPHNMMHLVSSIMGCTGQMRTTKEEEIPLAEFLNAHINNNSQRNGEAVPPFIFPREHDPGPDLAFVIQFGDCDTPSQYVCPVFVQLKLEQDLYGKTRQDACSTVQPEKIKGRHNVDIRQFCGEHGHYISITVAFPATISQFFKDKPVLEYHPDFGVTQIALVIDHSNICLFDEKHVSAVRYMKRCADEMSKDEEEKEKEKEERVVVNAAKRRRSQ